MEILRTARMVQMVFRVQQLSIIQYRHECTPRARLFLTKLDVESSRYAVNQPGELLVEANNACRDEGIVEFTPCGALQLTSEPNRLRSLTIMLEDHQLHGKLPTHYLCLFTYIYIYICIFIYCMKDLKIICEKKSQNT